MFPLKRCILLFNLKLSFASRFANRKWEKVGCLAGPIMGDSGELRAWRFSCSFPWSAVVV